MTDLGKNLGRCASCGMPRYAFVVHTLEECGRRMDEGRSWEEPGQDPSMTELEKMKDRP